MTRKRMNLLVTGLITGGLLVGLTACGSPNTTTVSSTAAETTVGRAADPVSTSTAPTAATSPATSTTSATTVAAVAPASSVAVNSAKPSTTAAAVTPPASKPDLSAVLALVDSAEKSAAAVDKELNTTNNAMNSTEQDPQP